MNRIRTAFAGLLGLGLLVGSLPAAAADKEYALKVTASPAVGNTTIRAVFRNTSPGGGASSNIKTLRFVTPDTTSGTKFTGAPTLTSPATSCVWSDYQVLCENLSSPIAKNQEFVMEVPVFIAAGQCSAEWNPPPNDDVNTGAQLGVGNWFEKQYPASLPLALKDYTSTLAGTGTPTISIAVTNNPTSLVWGTPYQLTATITDACGSTTSAAVNTTGTTSNIVVSPTSSTSTPFNFTATPGSGSTGTITVNAPSLGATKSLTFALFEDGNLACGDTLDSALANPGALPDTTPGAAGGTRGLVNAYLGDCPVAVNYSVDNLILTTTDHRFGFQWDLNAQRDAAFHLWANLPAQNVDTSGWPTAQPRLKTGWKYDGAGDPIYIKAVMCAAPPVASNYGTLTGVSGGTLTVTRTATPLPPTPFVVAINGKVVTVSAVNVAETSWTVPSGAVTTDDVGTAAEPTFIVSKYPLLPEVYGLGSVSGTTVTVASRSRDFPAAPFPITIAKDGTNWERMLVTAVNAAQTSLTVTRAHDGRPPVDFTGLTGLKIVSNPLPLIPALAIPSGVTEYTAGAQAQMCIVSDALSSIGLSSSGVVQVMRTIEWVDIGDGWIGTEN